MATRREYRLGVDIGTTFTAAAVAAGHSVGMLGLGNRAMQVPSVVFVQPDGTVLIGEAAEFRGRTDPIGVAREFKRRLGDPVPIRVRGVPYSPGMLTAFVLKWVVNQAIEREGRPPTHVVLTHPANWTQFKLHILRQVETLADVPTLSFMSEPVAAAAQYAATHRVIDGAPLCVYDLGGGTFDVCVLSPQNGTFETLGDPGGIEQLGGVDFDEAVFGHVLDVVGLSAGSIDPNDVTAAAAWERLRRDCIDAKEALSAQTEVVIPVDVGSTRRSVRIVRAEFEEMIRTPLEQTVVATRRALRAASITSTDVAAFILIGGSSRIPLVAEALTSAFGRPIALDTHPKHDVALGAARREDRSTAPDRDAVVPADVHLPSIRQSATAGERATISAGARLDPHPAALAERAETTPAQHQQMPLANYMAGEAKADPTSLPDDIRLALDSPHVLIRESAVRLLAEQLDRGEPGLAITARATLHRISEEDLPRVAALAAAALGAVRGDAVRSVDTTDLSRHELDTRGRAARDRAEQPTQTRVGGSQAPDVPEIHDRFAAERDTRPAVEADPTRPHTERVPAAGRPLVPDWRPPAPMSSATAPPQYGLSAAQQPPPWLPGIESSPATRAPRRRKTALIVAVIGILLIGAGAGAWFVLSAGKPKPLAAPQAVAAKLSDFEGSVIVSWRAVPNADHYSISDLTGQIPDTRVVGTSHVFKGAAAQDHRFVVTAYSSGGRAGRGSAPVLWRKLLPLTAPTGLTAKQSAFDLDLSWSAVRNATGYQLRDEDDPSFDPAISSGTTYVAKNAIYSSHIFTVTAVNGSRTGQPATTSWTPKHKLSAGEMALAYRLPSSFVVPGSCQSSAPDSDYISAEVSCDPASPRSDGPTILYADQIKSGDESAYESRAFGSNLPSRAGCHNVYPASGTEGTWSSDGKTIGNEYCFLASNGDSVFAWTYSADSIVLQIQGAPPATRTGLNAWWYATPGTGLLR